MQYRMSNETIKGGVGKLPGISTLPIESYNANTFREGSSQDLQAFHAPELHSWLELQEWLEPITQEGVEQVNAVVTTHIFPFLQFRTKGEGQVAAEVDVETLKQAAEYLSSRGTVLCIENLVPEYIRNLPEEFKSEAVMLPPEAYDPRKLYSLLEDEGINHAVQLNVDTCHLAIYLSWLFNQKDIIEQGLGIRNYIDVEMASIIRDVEDRVGAWHISGLGPLFSRFGQANGFPFYGFLRHHPENRGWKAMSWFLTRLTNEHYGFVFNLVNLESFLAEGSLIAQHPAPKIFEFGWPQVYLGGWREIRRVLKRLQRMEVVDSAEVGGVEVGEADLVIT